MCTVSSFIQFLTFKPFHFKTYRQIKASSASLDPICQWWYVLRVCLKMQGALHILKTPDEILCLSEGNEQPLARQRKSSEHHNKHLT